MFEADPAFSAKVEKTATCWLWRGFIQYQGYGELRRNRRRLLAHRYAWELANGPIPSGLFACHHCDNPPCVNPAHLFLGDHSANSNDKVSKGRQSRTRLFGSANPAAKLSFEQRLEIRRLRGTRSLKELAKFYSVSEATIRYTWSLDHIRDDKVVGEAS